MKTHWYKLSAADVLKQLGSDTVLGLASVEAQARLAKVGPNELVERGGRTRREIIVEQLTGVLTILLFIAALVSAVLGDWIEAVVILVIVVLNAVLGCPGGQG
jgi:Ca2+-transporting ATPase